MTAISRALRTAIETPHKNPLPQRAVGDENSDFSPMGRQSDKKSEINLIKRKIQETAARAHSTDHPEPPAVEGKLPKNDPVRRG